jgi:hypothetical protein
MEMKKQILSFNDYIKESIKIYEDDKKTVVKITENDVKLLDNLLQGIADSVATAGAFSQADPKFKNPLGETLITDVSSGTVKKNSTFYITKDPDQGTQKIKIRATFWTSDDGKLLTTVWINHNTSKEKQVFSAEEVKFYKGNVIQIGSTKSELLTQEYINNTRNAGVGYSQDYTGRPSAIAKNIVDLIIAKMPEFEGYTTLVDYGRSNAPKGKLKEFVEKNSLKPSQEPSPK